MLLPMLLIVITQPELQLNSTLVAVITTSSREISVVGFDWCIFPYHEIGILTWRVVREGGKAMSNCED